MKNTCYNFFISKLYPRILLSKKTTKNRWLSMYSKESRFYSSQTWGNAVLIMPIYGPYGMHWALTHMFQIIVNCNINNISAIIEIRRSSPTDFCCHSNSLSSWSRTFERIFIFKATVQDETKPTMKKPVIMLIKQLESS